MPAGAARRDLPRSRRPRGTGRLRRLLFHHRKGDLPGDPQGRIAWRQVAGPPLAALTPAGDGFALTGRTPPFRTVLPDPIPWGVVPLSPRTRGELSLEAIWRDDRGRSLRREIRLALAARSRGLPNTPIGARVYLGGEGWHLVSRPPGSAAAAETAGDVASLLPDVAGDYRLTDGQGRELTLRSARYDDTLLDCGRAGCHAAITDDAARSPMTTVLARGLAPVPGRSTPAFGPAYPDCALACHATGEPGLADGGFADVARELGWGAGRRQDWDHLPRPLRRLGGVGCLACHGPAALPPPSARWSLLRTDVCAVCHDAPPRYGHVFAWRGTGMARADRDPRASSERACARCHTTWGFLDPTGAHGDRRPPDGVGPVGITCAACHAVHEHETGGPPGALLRAPAAPALLKDAPPTSRFVHLPRLSHARPGRAAPFGIGRGGVARAGGIDPASGQPMVGAAPHAAVPGGCIGCHLQGPGAVARGAGHAFVASRSSCIPCHAQPFPPSDVKERAQRLWAAWRRAARAPAPGPAPAHASDVRLDRATPLGRAGWDVLLVLEDRAAAAHNARYARALLAAAAPTIAAADPGGENR